MNKSIKFLFLSAFLLVSFRQSFSEDKLDLKQLNLLKEKGMLSDEDYNILVAEVNGTLENENLYKLSVNGSVIDTKFKVIMKGDTLYFPVLKFVDLLGFFNVKKSPEKIDVSFNKGISFEIDTKNDTLKSLSDNELNKKIRKEKDYIIKEKDDYYIKSDIFKGLFLDSLYAQKQDPTISMRLAFNTPEEAAILFKVRQEDIKKELEKNEIVYMNRRKFFELGNARLQIYGTFDKQMGESKYKKDWEGSLEYQGALLFGNLKTSFDFKKKVVKDIELEYEDIFTKHDLTLGAYSAGHDAREFGFTLRKDTGYYELGKKFIISEEVPIGSKVELLYMGYPIQVEEAENGRVVFDNNLIRSNRSYQLRIYTPNGETETRYINTTQDYNQQNKGEVEYDINFREDYTSKRYRWDGKVYYGITNELTIGLGSKRSPEKIQNKYKFLDEGRVELTYGDAFFNNNVPITLKVGNDSSFTKGKNAIGKDYSDKYKFDELLQIGFKNLSFKTELEQYGKYYNELNKQRYEIEYGGFNNFTFGYEYQVTNHRNSKKQDENRYKIYYDKGLTSNLLLSTEVIISDKNAEEYRADFIYTGFSSFNVNWKNTWKDRISNYETELELYSNDFFGMLDYSFNVKYSEQLKERVGFTFTLNYDNFLKITGRAGEKGSRGLRVGVDRVIDLKNITSSVDTMDSSRVKVIAFIDGNDNNIYDEGEVKVDNVEVKIRDQVQVTNEEGEAFFCGVPNEVVTDLRPTIRKPSYSMGNNVIKIKGIAASTIEAYIPVKPMLTLSGNVQLDAGLKLSENEKQALYNDILIKIKDVRGNDIEVTMPDENGNFIVSGIFPNKYYVEIKYLGETYEIPDLKEKLELTYNGNSSTNIVLNIGTERLSLN